MAFIPVMIKLENKHAAVIGGGYAALKRINLLIDSGAKVTVISPRIVPELFKMYQNGLFNWRERGFIPEDLKDAQLIIAATDNEEVNKLICQSASKDVFINDMSDAERGSLAFSGSVKRGKLVIGVSTNGASPFLTSKIIKQLECMFDEDYEGYVDFLYECRQLIKNSPLVKEEKRRILKDLLREEYIEKSNQEVYLMKLKKCLRGVEDEGTRQ